MCNKCNLAGYAHQATHSGTLVEGTGAILFSPKLLTGNPIVKNMGPKGKALDKVAQLFTHVAVGVSFPANGPPQLAMQFPRKFWNCVDPKYGAGCQTMEGHVYVSMKVDVGNLMKALQLPEGFKLNVDARLMINFDPNGDGAFSHITHMPALAADLISGRKDVVEQLTNPETAVLFLQDMAAADFAFGVSGALKMTIPLNMWSHGLFTDMEVDLGTAQAMFRKSTHGNKIRTGVYSNLNGITAGAILNELVAAIVSFFNVIRSWVRIF